MWTEVDSWFESHLLSDDPVLARALERSAEAGLPSIHVAPNQGKLLHLFARMTGARRILEIGTLGGYSTIWMARALPPDGKLVTLEMEPAYADVARANLADAGLSDRVDIRLGPALETLARMKADGEAPFDLVFIDADKPNNPGYLDGAIELSRPGTLIIGDNVVRKGAVVDEDTSDEAVQGVRRFIEAMGRHPRLTATAVQTVGSKGYDGLAVALVDA